MSPRVSDDVQSVTTARQAGSEDLRQRQIHYFLAMGIRLVCFILAMTTPIGPLTWVWVIGAVVLPYVAVLLANNSVRSSSTMTAAVRRAPSLAHPGSETDPSRPSTTD